MIAARMLLVLCLLPLAFKTPSAWAQKAAARQAAPPVKWIFVTKPDQYENPSSDVYLQVGKRKVHVLSRIDDWRTVDPANYKSIDAPADAIAACSGWWAGQGDQLYVVRRGKRLDVYHREIGEGIDKPKYKRIKSVPAP